MIKRSLDILKSSSFFLFGARGTGKTTLMTNFFAGEPVFAVDLLEGQLYSDYLRTKDDAEVDLIVERPGHPIALVEIKSGELVDDTAVRTLEAFARTFDNAECFVLCRERQPRRVGKVQVFPWQLGIEALGI